MPVDMTIRRCLIIAALVGVANTHADDRVNRADADGDGYVSLHELRAAYYADPEFNARIERTFAAYDRNGDGLISAGERGAALGDKAEPAARPPLESLTIEPGLSYSLGTSRDVTTTPERSAADRTLDTRAAEKVQSSAGLAEERQSREAAWIAQIDKDRSGGASAAELIESGGGEAWFSERDFAAADKNGDGDLDETELAQLVRSIERRQR